jgi:hypothetical protein
MNGTLVAVDQLSQYSQNLSHSPDLSIIPKVARERVSSTPSSRRRTIPGSNFIPVYDESFNDIDGANPDNEEDSNTPTPPPADSIEASQYNPNTASRDGNTTALEVQSTSSDGNGDAAFLQNNDQNAINVERQNENTSPITNLVTEPIVQRTTNQTSVLSQNNHHPTPVNPFVERQTQERTQPIQQYNYHSNEFHAQQTTATNQFPTGLPKNGINHPPQNLVQSTIPQYQPQPINNYHTTADDSIFDDEYLQMSNKTRHARLNAAQILKDNQKLAITMSNLNVNPFPPVQFPQQHQMPTVMPPMYASPPYQQALVPPQHCYGLVAQSHHQQGQQSANRYGIAPASWGQQTYGRYPTGNPVPHFSRAYYPTQPFQQHNYNSATGMPTENPNGGGFHGYNQWQHTPAPTDAIQWSNYYQQQQHETYTNGLATLARQQADAGGAPVQDYSAQWAEYYRQMGMHEKAAMIEEQSKKKQTSSTSQ